MEDTSATGRPASGQPATDRDAALRLAKLLRANVELCARELERSYVREYPHSQANLMPREPIMDWSRSAVLSMAVALETGDLSALTYPNMPGDAVVDPHERGLSRLFNSVSTLFFYGRRLGPVVYRLSMADQAAALRMLAALETLFEGAVARNFELFGQSSLNPGSMLGTWQLMAPLAVETPDDGAPQADPHPSASPAATPASPHPYAPQDRTPALPAQQALSPREQDAMRLAVSGKTNGEIAAALGMSQNTVENHMARIFDKLNVNTRTELVAKVLTGGGEGLPSDGVQGR